MTLNDPRAIDYAFKVVVFDEWVWLFDDSSRTYLCEARPSIYMEALHPFTDSEERDEELMYDHPDPTYLHASDGVFKDAVSVDTWPMDLDEEEAWNEAREEANGNHRL